MKKIVALFIIVLVVIAGAGLWNEQSSAATCLNTNGTFPASNASVNEAIASLTGNNNRLTVGMFVGATLESDLNPQAVGNGSYGLFQIQDPGIVNLGITIPEAFNPADATRYMLPRYQAALGKVPDSLWNTNPEQAAEEVAAYAEQPAAPGPLSYYHSQGDQKVAYAFGRAVSIMQSLKLSTNFSTATTVGKPLTMNDLTPVPILSDTCSTLNVTDPTISKVNAADAKMFAQAILASSKVTYIFDAHDDIVDAAAGKPGTAGAMTSATLLKLVVALIQAGHSVQISAIQSHGSGHCDGRNLYVCPASADERHYIGDAIDISALDGTSLTGRDGPSMTVIMTAESVWPGGKPGYGSWSGFGQSQCGPAAPIPVGSAWTTYPDTCTHLHLDVPRGSP